MNQAASCFSGPSSFRLRRRGFALVPGAGGELNATCPGPPAAGWCCRIVAGWLASGEATFRDAEPLGAAVLMISARVAFSEACWPGEGAQLGNCFVAAPSRVSS